MKKLLVGLCAFGLLGVSPATAHDAPGIKCGFSVEDITTDDGGDRWTIWVKVRMRNQTEKDFTNPELTISVRDKFGNEMDFHPWTPGTLRAGKVKGRYFGLDYDTRPKTAKMTGCHRHAPTY